MTKVPRLPGREVCKARVCLREMQTAGACCPVVEHQFSSGGAGGGRGYDLRALHYQWKYLLPISFNNATQGGMSASMAGCSSIELNLEEPAPDQNLGRRPACFSLRRAGVTGRVLKSLRNRRKSNGERRAARGERRRDVRGL